MKMPTREELQRWVDVISDDATRKAIQAKLDTDPDFVREEIDRVIQQASMRLRRGAISLRSGSMTRARWST